MGASESSERRRSSGSAFLGAATGGAAILGGLALLISKLLDGGEEQDQQQVQRQRQESLREWQFVNKEDGMKGGCSACSGCDKCPASPRAEASKFDDRLVCAICIESWIGRSPVALDCGHVLCAKCLETYEQYHASQPDPDDEELACPSCRTPIRNPRSLLGIS
eukprot:tig00020830_g14469.t1